MAKTAPEIGAAIPYGAHGGKYDDKSEENICFWTNGFWAGLLWLMYLETGHEFYRETAAATEEKLDGAFAEFDKLHHDVGFMWMPSALANFKITGNDRSRRRAMLAASLLAARFNISGGFVSAWNKNNLGSDMPAGIPNGTPVPGWAIIDSMMNLPLLYWASAQTGDRRFAAIAASHADKTLDFHLRSDGSAYHIVCYDPGTGEVTGTETGQGYSPESVWSRGESWALYGYALIALHSGEERYLGAAKRAAHYWIAHTSGGQIPPCDFCQPKEPDIRDSAAAAIAACGLIELSRLVKPEESAVYFNHAIKTVRALDAIALWDNDGAQAILPLATHSYHRIAERHMNIIYADYFFTEAVMKLRGEKTLFWG
jgi:unsaturated chondroitin disaccharide hydrolase